MKQGKRFGVNESRLTPFPFSLFANPAVSLVKNTKKNRNRDQLFSLFGKCFQIWQEPCPVPTFLAGEILFQPYEEESGVNSVVFVGADRQEEGRERQQGRGRKPR